MRCSPQCASRKQPARNTIGSRQIDATSRPSRTLVNGAESRASTSSLARDDTQAGAASLTSSCKFVSRSGAFLTFT